MIGIDTILQKLKIKQIIGIIFFVTLILTLMPYNVATTMGLNIFKERFQIYISLCLIASSSYYLFEMVNFILRFIIGKINNPKSIAIRYIKKEK